jgi:UDP-3-O-[3-hydroxymyristoyl] glucosamine N-acyltransferase
VADLRFYRPLGPVVAQELAELTGSELRGDGTRRIEDVAPVDAADAGDITFLVDPKRVDVVHARRPGACVAPADLAARIEGACDAVLVNERPRLALARIAMRLWAPIELEHGKDLVSPEAEIDPTATIGPGAVVGPQARIGARTVIGPNAVIGRAVEIGADCRIGGGSHIEFARIGDRAQIGANCVIGGAGFGVAPSPEGPVFIPHLGAVRIGDDVRMGSLCAIDRGMFWETIIEDQVKMDNLCHIAHNCRIGKGALLAGFAGVSGSSTIGAGAVLGGRAGVADHITVGDGAVLGAFAGVMWDVPAGERWVGSPAKPNREFFREVAALRRLAKGGRRKDRSGEP